MYLTLNNGAASDTRNLSRALHRGDVDEAVIVTTVLRTEHGERRGYILITKRPPQRALCYSVDGAESVGSE